MNKVSKILSLILGLTASRTGSFYDLFDGASNKIEKVSFLIASFMRRVSKNLLRPIMGIFLLSSA